MPVTVEESKPKSPRRERLEARVTVDLKDLIQRAASLRGMSITEFVVSSAELEARKVVREHEVIKLNARESKALIELLENPPEPGERLVAAVKEYRKSVGI